MPKRLDQYGEKTINPYDATGSPVYYSDEPQNRGASGSVRRGRYVWGKSANTAPVTLISPLAGDGVKAHEAIHVAQLYNEPEYIWVKDQADIDRQEAGFGGGEVGKRRLDGWISKHKPVIDSNASKFHQQLREKYSRDPIEATATAMGSSDAKLISRGAEPYPEEVERAELSRKALFDYYDIVKQVNPQKAELLQAQGPESVRRGYANHPQPVRLPHNKVEEKSILDYLTKR